MKNKLVVFLLRIYHECFMQRKEVKKRIFNIGGMISPPNE